MLDFDRDHLWHPYSSMTRPSAPYLVESASGTRLRLRVGGEPREVIDAMASWWCAIHGYAVPELDAAARAQLDRMSHVMFGGLAHSPAVELGRRLVGLAPGSAGGGEMPAARALTAPRPTTLDKVFLADSGSVAVEVAMKMAWQARPGRRRMFTIRGGYHGDTFSCMSVCDPDGGMHAMYGGLVPRHLAGLVLAATTSHDAVLVEGVGGVTVNIGQAFSLLDIAGQVCQAGQPVTWIVVARAGLGTLNLTVRAIQHRGFSVHGIVIGSWPAEPGPAELYNRHDLASHAGVPVLGAVPEGAAALQPSDFQARAPGWIQTDSRPDERVVSGGAVA